MTKKQTKVEKKEEKNDLAQYLGISNKEFEELIQTDFDEARKSIAITVATAEKVKLLMLLSKVSYAEMAVALKTSKSNINRWINKPSSWDHDALDRALQFIQKKWPYKRT